MVAEVGERAIETRDAGDAVNTEAPLVTFPRFAVILEVPDESTEVAKPVESIVATETLLEFQVTVEVRFATVPSV